MPADMEVDGRWRDWKAFWVAVSVPGAMLRGTDMKGFDAVSAAALRWPLLSAVIHNLRSRGSSSRWYSSLNTNQTCRSWLCNRPTPKSISQSAPLDIDAPMRWMRRFVALYALSFESVVEYLIASFTKLISSARTSQVSKGLRLLSPKRFKKRCDTTNKGWRSRDRE